jgi:glycosyltransferase involved in cell wall biosynthesis
MNHSVKFSLVIPTYNRANYLGDALRSIIQQTYDNWEVIIIDDGGTDNSKEVVDAFNDKRMIYHYQQNSERGAARNAGTKLSTGDYITFLDSDDYLLPGYFSNAIEMISKNKTPEIFALSYVIGDGEKRKEIIHKGEINKELIFGNPLSCTGVFLRKDIAHTYLFYENRQMSGLEDWELWLRIGSIYAIPSDPRISAQMREHHERSVNEADSKKLVSRFEIFKVNVFSDRNVKRFLGKKKNIFLSGCDTYISLHLALSKNKKEAGKYLFSGIRYYPRFLLKRRFFAILKHLFSR